MKTNDTYRSIEAAAEGLYKEKGSRFIARAYPVESEEEIKAILTGLRREYHDARHCCYAYRLGPDGEKYRANDDGEPSGSAGRPILGQIDSAGLSDILVVVIRYFGGILLGVPGLIRSYKSATADALTQARICEKTAGRNYRLNFDYLDMNAVMKTIKDLSLTQSEQDFGERCYLTVRVRLSLIPDFLDRIAHIPSCRMED